jgi:hypothetical protein
MSNLHPVFQAALRGIAPQPRIRTEQRRVGSTTEVEFRGADQDEVYEAALDHKNSIDPYPSPAVKYQCRDGADWVVVLRFYGLD